MSNNDNNIEKRSFEAFVNAIGSEIEQAQVRLISAANAQMLFHYWKMGNYILYHQNRQGWGGKVIKKLAQAIRFNYPEKKGYSVRNLAYMCQFARSYPLGALRSFIETDAKLLTPSVQKITDELQSLNNMKFTQEPLAQIQSSDNKEIAIVQEPLAQIQDVAQTVATSYQIPIEDMEKTVSGIAYRKNQLGKPCDSAKQFPSVGCGILVYETIRGNGLEQQCLENAD